MQILIAIVSISISVMRETVAVTDYTFILNCHGNRDASIAIYYCTT
ncbi:MAG: hypothetical protein U9O50_01185 [Acidobacteriota bacterium]|nr:hypothetical protein [Acidobacteriota bacterium]